MQHTATHCNTLQHAATRGNTCLLERKSALSATHCNTFRLRDRWERKSTLSATHTFADTEISEIFRTCQPCPCQLQRALCPLSVATGPISLKQLTFENLFVTIDSLRWGWVISRTNADSQWNPVYKAFLRIRCCGDETIRRWLCKCDLDAANLRPALEHVCEKQTQSARILFLRTNVPYVPLRTNVPYVPNLKM